MKTNKKIIGSLLFPIACLVLLAGWKAYKVNSGIELVLPVTGYDPRDLLAGHYLTYRVNYGAPELCGKNTPPESKTEYYLCVSADENGRVQSFPAVTMDEARENECTAVIKGKCDQCGRFIAGIEKYYIPESSGADLDRKVRAGKGKILISVDRNGGAMLKELYIDDVPLRQYLSEK